MFPNPPIFIISSGRSGSTLLARVLAKHPNLAYLTPANERRPTHPWISRALLRGTSIPGALNFAQRLAPPTEAYAFWESRGRGFSRPFRDLVAEDVTDYARSQLRSAFVSIQTGTRNRLLIKITGWPRVGYLKEVFPEARFVYLIRDGRDVANSLLKVGFWSGWAGPAGWRLGPLTAEDDGTWQNSGRSFVALAGLEWKILVDAMDAARSRIQDDILNVRYEDFIREPTTVIRAICDHGDLPISGTFNRRVKDTPIRDRIGAYKQDLTASQQAVLQRVLRPYLARFGYE